MVVPEAVVRVKRYAYDAGTAMAGRFVPPTEAGASAAPALPGAVVDGADPGDDDRQRDRPDRQGPPSPGGPGGALHERSGVGVGLHCCRLAGQVGTEAVLERVGHGSITFLRSARARWTSERTVPGRQRRARAMSASGRSP